MKYILFLIIVLIVPGCQKVTIEPDFSRLQQQTIQQTGQTISKDLPTTRELSVAKKSYAQELSRNEAVRIALLNNPQLRADFDNLGVAKADLIQAGLFTNPSIDSVFRFPTKTDGTGTGQTNIESTASFRLSDLWQVPLSKNVAEDLLEIVSLRIFHTIIMLIADTKIAYDTCLAHMQKVKLYEQLVNEYTNLKDEIYYRQLYGYTTDLDKDRIDAQLKKIESDYVNEQAQLKTAFITLKQLLGVNPAPELTPLNSVLQLDAAIPAVNTLEIFALQNKPEVIIALMKIEQYDDTVALEKSRIFKQVDVGVSYKQDFEKPFRGWGPYINFEIPIFDNNYAQIARAQFLRDQAQKELEHVELSILRDIRTHYSLLQSALKEIKYYQEYVLPFDHSGIDYAYKYASTMQLPMTVAYESSIKLVEDNIQLIDLLHNARKEFTLLEKAVSTNLEHFFEKLIV